MDFKEAIELYLKKYPKTIITSMFECDEYFVFITEDDREGRDIINKNTKEISFMWIWDLIDEFDKKHFKEFEI